jgi:sigma-B regulation protein RsbU (phosphoserine phosphatase)
MVLDTKDGILQHDLQLAYDIQQSFLPDRLPPISGAEVAASMTPAREVGGDFYDVIPLSSGRLGILIADVSGKGIPAALYMALARTLLRAYSLSAQPRYLTDALQSASVLRLMRSGSMGALAALGAVRQTNEYLVTHHRQPVMFLTLFYAVYEPQSRLLTYVNAGHNPPLLHNTVTGEQRWLRPTDMAVGLISGSAFEAHECPLCPGELLVMYTDGVTEAFNPQHELYGSERLAEAVASLASFSADAVLGGIVDGITAFAAGAPQSDDVTLAILKVHDTKPQDT